MCISVSGHLDSCCFPYTLYILAFFKPLPAPAEAHLWRPVARPPISWLKVTCLPRTPAGVPAQHLTAKESFQARQSEKQCHWHCTQPRARDAALWSWSSPTGLYWATHAWKNWDQGTSESQLDLGFEVRKSNLMALSSQKIFWWGTLYIPTQATVHWLQSQAHHCCSSHHTAAFRKVMARN